jgi:hypothetical protein
MRQLAVPRVRSESNATHTRCRDTFRFLPDNDEIAGGAPFRFRVDSGSQWPLNRSGLPRAPSLGCAITTRFRPPFFAA